MRLPSSCDEPDGVAGMYDDARAVREAIDAIDGGVTVLAHSYGGIPVTEATAGVAGKVERIVYLSAFQFDVGDSLANQSRGRLSEGESGTIPPNPEPGAYLYNGVAVQDAELAAKQLVAQSLKSFSQPLTNAGWKSIPSSYIVCGEDRAIPAELQRAMAARATDVHELPDAGHSPFLSMPERLAEVVTAAARG